MSPPRKNKKIHKNRKRYLSLDEDLVKELTKSPMKNEPNKIRRINSVQPPPSMSPLIIE